MNGLRVSQQLAYCSEELEVLLLLHTCTRKSLTRFLCLILTLQIYCFYRLYPKKGLKKNCQRVFKVQKPTPTGDTPILCVGLFKGYYPLRFFRYSSPEILLRTNADKSWSFALLLLPIFLLPFFEFFTTFYLEFYVMRASFRFLCCGKYSKICCKTYKSSECFVVKMLSLHNGYGYVQ